MIHVLADVRVEDFDRFLEGFNTRGMRLRQKHGSHGARVFRHRDDANRVSLLLEWEGAEALAAFLADPDVGEWMRLGGVVEPPQVTLLDPVEELPF
jgi:quinol monooxygenase YgiN